MTLPEAVSLAPGDSYDTLETVAARFDVTPRTVSRWIKTGVLPAVRVGPRLVRIRPEDVEALCRPIPTGRPKP